MALFLAVLLGLTILAFWRIRTVERKAIRNATARLKKATERLEQALGSVKQP